MELGAGRSRGRVFAEVSLRDEARIKVSQLVTGATFSWEDNNLFQIRPLCCPYATRMQQLT